MIKQGILFFLGAIGLLATLFSFLPGPYWWIRIFDYPRLQVACLCLLVFTLSLFWIRTGRLLKYLWLALLAAAVVIQATKIIVYTPFYPKQVLSSSKATYTNSVRLLVSNVHCCSSSGVVSRR